MPGASTLLSWAMHQAKVNKIENYNAKFSTAYDAVGAEQLIEISPEMARFLADDHQVVEAQKQVLASKDNKKWAMEAKIVGNGIIAAKTLGQWRGISTLTSMGERVMHHIDIESEKKRIIQERDQIAHHVLELYYVTEPESGKYFLERGKLFDVPKLPNSAIMEAAKASINPVVLVMPDFERIVIRKGFDPKIDLSKLPPLSNQNPDVPGH